MIADFFTYSFLLRALIAGVVLSIGVPLIGTFLVARRYALMADSLAHVALAGVAIGVFFQTQPVVTALVVTVCSAVLIEYLRQKTSLYGESLLSLFLSGSLAFAIVLMSVSQGFNVNLLSFLFGSITTVSTLDLTLIVGLTFSVVVLVVVFYKEFFSVVLDEELAKASGLPVTFLHYLLVIFAAAMITVSLRIVGVLLIGALMVIPVLAAMNVSRSFKKTLILSVFFSVFSVIVGLFSSFAFDIASGGAIVLTALVVFILSVVFRRK